MDDRVRALVERALEQAEPDDDPVFREWIDAFFARKAGVKETESVAIHSKGFEAGVRAACGGDVLVARARARAAVVHAVVAKRPDLDQAIDDATAALEAITQASGNADEAPFTDPEAVAFDRLLGEIYARLARWSQGSGPTATASLDERTSAILGRTVARVVEARMKLREEAEKDAKKSPMPTQTSIRDLLTFVVDQLHRYDDALAVQGDRSHRTAFADTVARDVVYRICAPYLSQTFGISLDTSVVVGADTSRLVGRFRRDTTGPRPKRPSNVIYSVVVPALVQGGTCIRPAVVRTGEY
ncbi:MAG TPA: hypothetical protein VFF73_41225 [Planctomycetota bacterium]|nr:hypothetical protein [Planctomycetota bacterium]